MKVNVDLFKPSGKWAYGGVVDVDESFPIWSSDHKQDLVNKQKFVVDGSFDDYIVVVTHREDYDQDPSPYFCQQLYPVGSFKHFRKRFVPDGDPLSSRCATCGDWIKHHSLVTMACPKEKT